MSSNRNSYGNILKAIGLFGGTQAFHIIIGMIRTKFVAILLGPIGMGINGLLISTTSLVNSITGLGLRTSAVRDIARAYESKNEARISRVTAVMRKLVWLTGFLGMMIVLVFAKQLSIWTFQSADYTWAFRIVSLMLLFEQLRTGQNVLMQGTFHYKYIAQASIWGSLVGLFVSVPLYYFFREKAIAPVILIVSAISLAFSWYYSRKVPIQPTKVTLKDVLSEGRVMIVLGLAVAMSGILREGKSYITRIFISSNGLLADVGMYTAAMTIATQYINVILNAMSSDYSPRLAAVSDKNEVFIETINRQNKLMITIITPFILALIVFIRPFVLLLYSKEFLDITGMIEWIMLGMFFRTMSWCLSYTLVAKGEAKSFFWNEALSTVYSLALFMVGYKLLHFTGIGIGYCLSYVIYTLQFYVICRKKYVFRYSSENIKLLLIQVTFVFLVFFVLKFLGYSAWRYAFGVVALIVSCIYTYKRMDEMIPIKEVWSNLKNRLHKKKQNEA